MAPENSTAGKHSIGSASVAWATFLTAAEASRPSPSAATEHSSRLNVIDAYVPSGRLGRRFSRRRTASMATITTRSTGTSTVTFEAT